MAYRIASCVVFGWLLAASSGCTITVQSGPSSPSGYAPAPVVGPAPATTVYVPTPVAHAPANPRIVAPAPAQSPAAQTPPAAAAAPAAQTPPYRPTGGPTGRASDLPPGTAAPRAPALPSAPVGHGVIAPPAATPPAATPPAAAPIPQVPGRKGNPRAEKQPQGSPSVK